MYSTSFMMIFLSLPYGAYQGMQIRKFPEQAKTFLFRSLLFSSFSSALFGFALFRQMRMTTELSKRYLLELNNY